MSAVFRPDTNLLCCLQVPIGREVEDCKHTRRRAVTEPEATAVRGEETPEALTSQRCLIVRLTVTNCNRPACACLQSGFSSQKDLFRTRHVVLQYLINKRGSGRMLMLDHKIPVDSHGFERTAQLPTSTMLGGSTTFLRSETCVRRKCWTLSPPDWCGTSQ